MRVLRKIPKVIALVIVALIAVGFIMETTLKRSDRRELAPPGDMVEVHGRGMHIYSVGEGKNTIVLIPGHGTTSPYVDFQPVWSRLARENRVVVVERFGYGFSDMTNRDRSLENIVGEMHEALNLSGQQPPYTLVGHSLGGLIGIAYAQAYPNEVANIVMLDSLTPSAYLEFEIGAAEKITAVLARGLNSIGLNRLVDMEAVYEMSDMNSYIEVPKELWDVNRRLFLRNYLNRNVRSELQNLADYARHVSGLGNVYDVPTLFISTPDINFKDKQDEYIKNIQRGYLVELEGGHYLHQYVPNEIEEAITRFIK